MRATVRYSILAVLVASSTPVAAQGIVVDDFASGSASYSLTTTVPVRRGVTSRVRIVKDLIDLVPFNLVSVSGGGTIGSITNGRQGSGLAAKGYIEMNLTVPSNQTLGSTITLKVGLSDEFRFRAVHRGLVSTVAKTPDPSTILAAAPTPWVATVRGTDLGNVQVQTVPCHNVARAAFGNDSVRFTLTKTTASCPNTSFPFNPTPGTGANEAPSYRTSSGSPAGFAFVYNPGPPGNLACSSAPNIGTPRIASPANGQTLVFGAGVGTSANVTVRWDSLTSNSVPAPNNEWILTRKSGGTGTTLLIGGKTASTTVQGLQTTVRVAVPGTHSFSLRPRNCGTSAPSASVTFTTTIQ